MSLTYTVPLFDGLSNYSIKENALSDFYINKSALQLTARSTYAYFERSRKNFTTSFKTMVERLNTLKLSKTIFKDSLNQFKQGRLSVNDLLVEQSRLLQTQQLANQGLYNAHLGLIDLCHSLGKRVYKECM